MNKYARLAMSHWQRCSPRRVRALEDPTAFFTDLGEEVQAQVSDLARLLAGPDLERETYREKIARLQAATRTAEEVVMAQLVWTPAPELTLTEAREEWEQTFVIVTHNIELADMADKKYVIEDGVILK